MAPGRSGWRAGSWSWLSALAIALAGPLAAQDAAPTVVATTILTLDQDRFFLESSFGKATIAREQEATRILEAENGKIEAELIAEEQDLTNRRPTLPAAEFTTLASAFDAKVERIRGEQDAKARALTQGRDKERQEFLRVAVPVLGELMSEKGAIAILDKTMIILSLSAIDITDEAIAKVDATQAETPAAP